MLPQGKIKMLAPCQRKGKGVGVRRAEQFMSTPEVLPPPQQGAAFRSGLRPRKWFRLCGERAHSPRMHILPVHAHPLLF